jgi:hypothetical protein
MRAGDAFSTGELSNFPVIVSMRAARSTTRNVLAMARESLQTQVAGLKELEGMGCVDGPMYGPMYQDIVGYRKDCLKLVKMAERHVELIEKRRGEYVSAFREFVATMNDDWRVEGDKVGEKFRKEDAAFRAKNLTYIEKTKPNVKKVVETEAEELERMRMAAEKCIREVSAMHEEFKKRKDGA